MINNKLTSQEFEKVLTPIFRLDDIDLIKSTINKVLHFNDPPPLNNRKYIISADSTGVNSTFKAFEIQIRSLEGNVIIHFKKNKTFINYFNDPMGQIVRRIKQLCLQEIHEGWFSNFNLGNNSLQYVHEEISYQLGTQNPKWKEQNKLSPLTIYTKQDSNSYVVELLFTPICYERIINKTVLKENWLDIFCLYSRSW